MNKYKIKGEFFVLMATVLWGTTGTSQAMIGTDLNPLVIGTLRMVIGGTLLMVIAISMGAFKDISGINIKEITVATICMALYQPLFFLGVSKAGVALGTVIGIGSAPIFSGLIERIRGTRLSKQWMIATVVSILGCLLITKSPEAVQFNIFGAILAMGAGFVYSLFVTTSKSSFQHAQRLAVNAIIFFGSAVLLFPILLVKNFTFKLQGSDYLVILHLGVLATALAYTFFAIALKTITPSLAVTLSLGEPLTASILGVAFLREPVGMRGIIGMILVFIGLIIGSNVISFSRRIPSKAYK